MNAGLLFALLVGTNVNITRLTGNQTETAIAIDPTNPKHMFAATNGSTITTSSLFYYSTNASLSWAASIVTNLPVGCCDESSSWDNFGNLFVTYLAKIGGTAVVALSTNGGASFTILAELGSTIDQPTITTGPGGTYAPGSVWITYLDGVNGLVAQGAAVYGFGSVGAFGSAQTAPGPSGDYGDIAVGPNGQILVTY
jgi:hypothetical protein